MTDSGAYGGPGAWDKPFPVAGPQARDEVVTTTMFSAAEHAAWQVAVRRGLALTAADLRHMLEGAAPLIAAAERDRIRQFAREVGAWVPGKPAGPMRSRPGRFFADLLEAP